MDYSVCSYLKTTTPWKSGGGIHFAETVVFDNWVESVRISFV